MMDPSSSGPSNDEELFRLFLSNADSNEPNPMAREVEEIMKAVQNVIDESDMFPDEDERLTAMFRMTEYLSHLESQSDANPANPFQLPAPLRSIQSIMKYKDGKMLKPYVKSLYEKCMKPENQERYEQWKAQHLNRFLTDNDTPPDPNLHQNVGFNAADAAITTRERAVQVLGHSTQWLLQQLLKIPQKLVNLEITTALDEVLQALGTQWGLFLTTLGTSLGVAGVIALYNLWCYHRGTQSLQRTKKSIIDNTTALVVGNAAGFATFSAITAIFGPLGFFVGLAVQAVVGFAVGAVTRHYVSKWTTKYFDIPKAKALEDAYRKLGLSKQATDNELSKKCRELCRELHPDYLQRQENPPDEEGIKAAVDEFIEIQNAYKFIKTMREAEQSGQDHNENLDWKQNFMFFVKNLISLRRKDYAKEEELLKAIDFEVLGFPPEEAFEAVEAHLVNYDVDAPLRTAEVGVRVEDQTIGGRWWQYFWESVGSHAYN